jgi:hypothetical protein
MISYLLEQIFSNGNRAVVKGNADDHDCYDSLRSSLAIIIIKYW